MNKIVLIILILFAIHFWQLAIMDVELYSVTNALSMLLMVISLIKVYRQQDLQFKTPIILFIIGIMVNIVSAYFNHGQNPVNTFFAFGNYFFILAYFYLHEIKISRHFLEKVIISFAIIYSLLYFVQILVYPSPIFNFGIPFQRSGIIRMTTEGSGFLILAYFLTLKRFLQDRKLISLILTFVFFAFLLMRGYRTLTVVALLLSFIMFFRLGKLSPQNIALFALFILLIIGLFQFKFSNEILDFMVSKTQTHMQEGQRYIRFIQMDYFFTQYPKNFSYYLFGGGLPTESGFYAEYMYSLMSLYGFFWVDIGMFGFYIVIGIIALAGLLWYAIKAIFIKINPDYCYLNYFFAYLVLCSFTTREIFRPGIFIVEAIGLYLIDYAIKEEKLAIR